MNIYIFNCVDAKGGGGGGGGGGKGKTKNRAQTHVSVKYVARLLVHNPETRIGFFYSGSVFVISCTHQEISSVLRIARSHSITYSILRQPRRMVFILVSI